MKFFTWVYIVASVIILGLIGKHIYYAFKKDDTQTDTFKSLNIANADTVIVDTESNQDNTIPPLVQEIITSEDLKKCLVGKWEFELKEHLPNKGYRFKGKVNYEKDGTFVKNISLEAGDGALYNSTDFVYSGNITGLWTTTSDLSWKEQDAKCSVVENYRRHNYEGQNTEVKNPCKLCLKEVYGNVDTDNVTTHIKFISDTVIIITGNTYSPAAELEYVFRKVTF